MKKWFLQEQRNSHIEEREIYFWTVTINGWRELLKSDAYKDVIINSWQYLADLGKIDVFAFVIMPTHLHSIWRINEPNGKETSQGSFLKYTAHMFQKMLKEEGDYRLHPYRVDMSNKNYEFWQRDPLAVPLFTRKMAIQKLNYIHNNPIAKQWKLAKDPCDYKYSSARYYELNEQNFSFLKDLWEEF